MPIYAYRCSACDCQKDVMQKMSDAPLTVCPECGKTTFAKQLTAAGFQLKGSGYYVTDFKGGPKKSDSGQPDAGKPEAKPEKVAVPAAGAAPSPVPSGTS